MGSFKRWILAGMGMGLGLLTIFVASVCGLTVAERGYASSQATAHVKETYVEGMAAGDRAWAAFHARETAKAEHPERPTYMPLYQQYMAETQATLGALTERNRKLYAVTPIPTPTTIR